MNEWKVVKLGEYASFIQGLQVPVGEQFLDPQDGRIRFVRIVDFTKNDSSDFRYITKPASIRYLVTEDDLVMIRYGSKTAGKIARGFNGIIANNTFKIEPNSAFGKNFLYYFLSQDSIYEYFRYSQSSSTMPAITFGMIGDLDVPLPPLEEQKAITAVLSSLDDKIDLLHRQNKTLEALAQTLFRHWFIDGADDDWEDGILDDVLSAKGGTTPSTKNPEYWNGDICWTTPRDLSNHNSLYLLDTARKITVSGLSKISSGLLPKGTLLLSSRAPVGYLGFSEVPIAINQGYIAIIDNKSLSKHFIYLWLKENMDYVKSYASGTTFQEISKSSFRSLEIVIPPADLRVQFEQIVAPQFEKIRTNTHQIRTLEKLRDTLLPKLMSGKVRVRLDQS